MRRRSSIFKLSNFSIVRSVFGILPIFLIIACSSATKTDSRATENVSVLQPIFVSPIILYLLGNETITLSAIQDAVEKSFPSFKKVDTIPDSITFDGYRIKLVQQGDKAFVKPDVSLLSENFLNLTEQETKYLDHSTRGIELIFFGTDHNIIEKQLKINNLVQEITEGKNVVVVDGSTIEFYNSNTWREHRKGKLKDESLNITEQVTIHTYREGEFCRVVTLGMNKFCLPEISLTDFTCSDQNPFGNLVNAVIQTMIENPFINRDSTLTIDLKKIRNITVRDYLTNLSKEGAQQVTKIRFKNVEPKEGDNDALQFQIVFQNPEYSSPQEEQTKFITELFGAEESIVYAEHDEELLQASEKAKTRIPELRKLFREGLAPGYSIMVKKPFPTDAGGNEWMWVEITVWSDESIKGILQNDPYEISNLKAGAVIEFNESEIFDYMLNLPDGSYEGNETGKILEQRN